MPKHRVQLSKPGTPHVYSTASFAFMLHSR